MKSATLSKVFGVCAISFLSLSGGTAQAGDSCVLSALSRPAVSTAANVDGGCANANPSAALAQDRGMVASVAPLMGSMAKGGMQTASSVMKALSHEASRLLQE